MGPVLWTLETKLEQSCAFDDKQKMRNSITMKLAPKMGQMEMHTLQGTNISHLKKRKIIFKYALSRGYVSSLEGIFFGRFCLALPVSAPCWELLFTNAEHFKPTNPLYCLTLSTVC